jgi:hypothetical protein
MASLFDTLEIQAFRAGVPARTDKSRKWFQRKIKELGKVQPRKVLKDTALHKVTRPLIGDMIMYFYDPKLKAELPYYDRFPLTIMVQPAKGGFHGLNLHYLNPTIRALFLDELMKLGPSKISETTRITKLKYRLLNGVAKYKEFKPCFKHYLMNHVDSQITRVGMPEWEIAVFLPTQQFKKKSAQAVWAESRKIYKSV